MKRFILAVLLLLSATVIVKAQEKEQHLLTSKVFSDSLKTQTNAILIDVRTPEEYKENHIFKAINLNVKDTAFVKQASALDKSKSYYLYCRSGKRSALAADELRKLGFVHIYELDGGITQWIADALPIQSTVKD